MPGRTRTSAPSPQPLRALSDEAPGADDDPGGVLQRFSNRGAEESTVDLPASTDGPGRRAQVGRRERFWRALRIWLTWSLVVVLVGFIVGCVVWSLGGGRWERVESPSMGTRAPVGSLLWTRPVSFDTLEKGDFITFHSPGNQDINYSHLVHRVHADGTVSTKGVLPAKDPWRIGPDEVVGKVVMVWPGIGWLVVAMPVLLIGAGATAVLRMGVERIWKPAVVLVGLACTLSVAIAIYQPLIGAEQLAQREVGGDQVVSFVATGLLPTEITPVLDNTNTTVVLGSGEVGDLRVRVPEEQTDLRFAMHPDLRWYWWALLVVLCFLPAGVASLRRRLSSR